MAYSYQIAKFLGNNYFFYLGVTPAAQTAKNRGLFFAVLGSGGRALRHYALASVLRSTAHCSLRRMATIPNAVILSSFLSSKEYFFYTY